jgi:hypothetical protein
LTDAPSKNAILLARIAVVLVVGLLILGWLGMGSPLKVSADSGATFLTDPAAR